MNDIFQTELKSPIAVIWAIPVRRLRKLKDKHGQRLISDSFAASNIFELEYFIGIYPNGLQQEKRGEVCIFLYLDLPDGMKIESDFKISIEAANFCDEVKYTFEKSVGKVIKCCTTEELFDLKNGYILDGKLTIKVDGILTTKKKNVIPKQKKIGNRDLLCVQLWNQDDTKDFAILAEGKKFTAHKWVLGHRSPVFAAMFQSGMKEAKENKVEIEDFEFEIIEKSIKSCYHSSLIGETTLEEKMKMLQFFDKYDIQPLKNKLETHLITVIDSSNVCLLTNFSLLANARKLERKCTEFIQDCLKKGQPIIDINLLDKDFALNMFQNAFYHVSSS